MELRPPGTPVDIETPAKVEQQESVRVSGWEAKAAMNPPWKSEVSEGLDVL